MEYKSKLHEWLRNATPGEQQQLANKVGCKVHFLQRIARGEVRDPGIVSLRKIVDAVNEYNLMLPDNRLPDLSLDDF